MANDILAVSPVLNNSHSPLPQHNLVGIAPGTYRLNGITYFGQTITEITTQAIREQANNSPAVDWEVCECGKVIDLGSDCPDCADTTILINRPDGFVEVV